jgi:hypothetical protein
MANNSRPQFREESVFRQERPVFKQQRVHDVGQDNSAPLRDRVASDQPASRQRPARSQSPRHVTSRTQKRSSKRRTAPVTTWLARGDKAELARMAEAEGLSHSKLAAAFITEGMRQKLHIRHAVLLGPIIETAIAKERKRDRTRFASLLVRLALEIGQTRHITANILGRQQGMTTDRLNKILDWSGKKARGNLTSHSPEIIEAIQAVEAWLAEGEEAEPKDR